MRRVGELSAYEVLSATWIDELKSQAVICRHKKSGARLFLLSNDDDNKVFTIGFRTPPADDTGLPHILEHSVLCGSRKFPVKDPFVELVKGSLNTFLNAMTYPDKTVYPVASCNDKDFQNLMDVYMDSVLHPNICENKKIFLQEGWHYELEDVEKPLTINGVVYNEMIGAYSQAESLLDSYTAKALYPDTCYSRDSGGNPDFIPTLSYEDFTNFYQRYYHPSNSYIYLYGDMDMAEKLSWLDEAYLKDYDIQEIDSHIPIQPAFDRPVEQTYTYPLTEEESEAGQTYLSVNTVVGTQTDPKLYVAFQILEYALLSSPGAPVKQALLDAGIGRDILGGYYNSLQQPYFSVVAKNAESAQKDEFLRVVDGELRRIAREGVNRKSLEAALNYYEFRYREADYGSFPKGLMYGLQCFDSWLYDENDPLMHLAYAGTFCELRKEMESGYFEGLIERYLLDNPHTAVVVLKPEKGLSAKKEAALADRLAQKKASLTTEQTEALVEQTRALKEYQDEPTDPELLKKIPLLAREDIKKEVAPLNWTESEDSGVRVLHHNLFTAGIGYLRLLFDIDTVADEDLQYLGLLKATLGYMDTENYGYQELANEILIHTGGIAPGMGYYADMKEPGKYRATFEFMAKVFYDKLGFGFEMITEIIKRTEFDDEKRLREILAECKSRIQMQLMSAGHQAAVQRAASYLTEGGCLRELTGGISWYKFIEDLDAHFDERKTEVVEKLKALTARIFVPDRLLVSYTADDEGFSMLHEPLASLVGELYEGGYPTVKRALPVGKKNEGFMSSSGVQYVAQCGNFRKNGFDYTGALRILKLILSYDYLWLQLRVKGGAYGCMSGFSANGDSYLVSYRDPHLRRTLEVYQGIPQYLRDFEADEREMTKYIIGTISEMDTPLNPMAKGSRSLSAYLCHTTWERLKKERDQVLTADPEDIRALAPLVESLLAEDSICVMGSVQKCREDSGALKELCSLFEQGKEEEEQDQ
ncbi:MAG: insulinase family protein [Lachnospiraceae bacterium]|nr:insulinase family protein [Lachnospiraceae bacterium]